MAANTTLPLTPDSPAPERLPEIVRRLREAHPDARCALDHSNPYELLVATMLSASGFQVYDLGVDVPTENFITKVRETGADLLGLSALLTTTMIVQRQVIEALREAGIREQVKVIIGGAPVNQEWANTIGADGYAEDAVGAVELARRLVV